MVKRFLALLMIVTLCLTLLWGCEAPQNQNSVPDTSASDVTEATVPVTSAPIPEESTIKPLLYQVSDDNGNIIWLFGSIHVGLDSYYPLPQYVTEAFESSDALAVEVDIVMAEYDLVGQLKCMNLLSYPSGSKFSTSVPEETYNRAVAILKENGMYSIVLEQYVPAFWWSCIETLTCEKLDAKSELGIDRHLINLARDQEKEIREVESAEFQYTLMADFSPELQLLLLEDAIEGYENLEQSDSIVKELMRLWASGDEQAFSAYLSTEEENSSEEEAALYAEYTSALITQRNISMTEYAVDALASGDQVFICVGAAHIVGPGAIAENLRQLGYTVELVA